MNLIAVNGVLSDGFSSTGAPAAIAGASLCATWLSGWLNGVIAATSDTGCRKVTILRFFPLRRDVAGEHLPVVLESLDGCELQHVRGAPRLVVGLARA